MKARVILAAAALLLAVPAFSQNDGDVQGMTLGSGGTGGGLTYDSVNEGLDMGAYISGGVDWSVIPKRLSCLSTKKYV